MSRADPKYAIRRNEAHRVADFPAHPVLDPAHRCHGVVLLDHDAAEVGKLRPIRGQVCALWHGQLDATPVLIALFNEPTALGPIGRGRMLPLSGAQGHMLASFQADGLEVAHSELTPNDARQLDLWWHGRRHRVMLTTLRRLSIAELWDMPQVTRHAPRRNTVPTTTRRDSKGEDGKPKAPKEALLPINGDNDIRIEDAAERERALDLRTSLRAITAQLWYKMRGNGSDPAPEKAGADGPGVLTNMVGWLLWHTPLGIPLARQLAHRMRLVERLMAAGDVDSALRLALQLGAAGQVPGEKKSYPLRLPSMRNTLDFKFNMGAGAPILPHEHYASLQNQYDALANRMEAQGDFKRAAYIRSQLQGSHYLAVDTLERGQLFLDAAKLAMDAKLPPARAVALFYKAGAKDTALALAKRTECFDHLAESSRKDDPEFHAFVLRAWTDRLIATGQPLRALHVTDALAVQDAGNADLAALRLSWIDMLLDDAPDGAPMAEAVARALFCGAWVEEDAALAAFAVGNPVRGAGRNAVVLRALHEWMQGQPEMLGALFASLLRLGNTGHAAQASFWAVAAPVVMERLVRAFAVQGEGRHSQDDKNGVSKLLRMAGLEVLATDWRKLQFQSGGTKQRHREWTLPKTTERSAAAVHGCLLGNDTMLVWREIELLQLYDVYGRILWQGNMSLVSGLVPIGAGGDALILQPVAHGYQLTRFVAKSRRFVPLGVVALSAWHDITSDGQWLVQWDGRVGALDLTKLCAPVPEFEFLWSAHLTQNVQVVSFAHDTGHPDWLTIDVSDTRRNGMMEAWSMRNGRDLHNSIWDFEPDTAIAPGTYCYWIWRNRYHCKMAAPSSPWSLKIQEWSEQNEWRSIALLDKRRRMAPDCQLHFVSCDQNRMSVEFPPNAPALLCTVEGQKGKSLTIKYDDDTRLSCLARGTAHRVPNGDSGDPSHIALFAADDGRLLYVDVFHHKVIVF